MKIVDILKEYENDIKLAKERVDEKKNAKQDDVWNDLGNTLYEMGNEDPQY